MNTLAQRYARAFYRAARGLPKRLVYGEGNSIQDSQSAFSYVDFADAITDTAPPFCPGREPAEALTTLRSRRRAQTSVGRLLFEACDH